jgi:hypothetical protein
MNKNYVKYGILSTGFYNWLADNLNVLKFNLLLALLPVLKTGISPSIFNFPPGREVKN